MQGKVPSSAAATEGFEHVPILEGSSKGHNSVPATATKEGHMLLLQRVVVEALLLGLLPPLQPCSCFRG